MSTVDSKVPSCSGQQSKNNTQRRVQKPYHNCDNLLDYTCNGHCDCTCLWNQQIFSHHLKSSIEQHTFQTSAQWRLHPNDSQRDRKLQRGRESGWGYTTMKKARVPPNSMSAQLSKMWNVESKKAVEPSLCQGSKANENTTVIRAIRGVK